MVGWKGMVRRHLCTHADAVHTLAAMVECCTAQRGAAALPQQPIRLGGMPPPPGVLAGPAQCSLPHFAGTKPANVLDLMHCSASTPCRAVLNKYTLPRPARHSR